MIDTVYDLVKHVDADERNAVSVIKSVLAQWDNSVVQDFINVYDPEKYGPSLNRKVYHIFRSLSKVESRSKCEEIAQKLSVQLNTDIDTMRSILVTETDHEI